jgi:hypothetical protein
VTLQLRDQGHRRIRWRLNVRSNMKVANRIEAFHDETPGRREVGADGSGAMRRL